MLRRAVSYTTALLLSFSVFAPIVYSCDEPQLIHLRVVEKSLDTLPDPIRAFLLEKEEDKEALVGALCLYRMHRHFKTTLYCSLIKGVSELELSTTHMTRLQSINFVHDYILPQRSRYIKESSKKVLYLRWFQLFRTQIASIHGRLLAHKEWHIQLRDCLFQSLEEVVDYLDQHFVDVDRAVFGDWYYPEEMARDDLQSIKEECGLKACLEHLRQTEQALVDAAARVETTTCDREGSFECSPM